MANAPSNLNVTLGRGEIWLRRTDAGGFIHMGNCISLSIGFEDQIVRSMNKMRAGGGTYRRVVVDRQCNVTIEGQEFNADILGLALSSGVPQAGTQIAGSATDEVLAVDDDVLGDRAYQTAFRRIDPDSVVISQGATTLVADNDYTITDPVAGIITFHSDGDNFVAGTQLDIDYDYDADANPIIGPGAVNQIEGTLLFKGDPATGMAKDMIMWRVAFSPEGDLEVIGDDFLTWTLSGEALDEGATYPDHPFYRIYDRNDFR